MIKNASESRAEERAVHAVVGQLFQEPQKPVDRNDLRVRHLSQTSVSGDEGPRTCARQRERESIGDR